ncbi:hypothetical protein [Winogradskyella luteola]|uniref:Uncharacterized protein n=1 Tax=Winogradskyella luteola TaxID=2828330 RepID=A0A9X1JTI8_9FLAO|nr:hypothetical protein [Winogradskyella luteola]MBV7270667.1 hypothetical protein [Winogradskyella luteola]
MKKNKQEISEHLGEIDLFICSSGFEDRSTLLGLSLNSSLIKRAVAFHLNETYSVADENINLIRANITNLETIVYPKNEPIDTFDLFYNFLNDFIGQSVKSKVLIDVTTFTKEVLLILIRVLSLEQFINSVDVTLAYTPANHYPEWLTKGIRQIRSVFGYSGLHSPSKKLLLIILNGFENERTQEIIDSFEPNAILLGKPSQTDSINSDLSAKAEVKYDYIANEYKSSILENFEFSCLDVIETKNTINELIDKYNSEYNVVISPLNNKVSTLGVAMVGIDNEVVQICYASANQYNIKSFPKGCDYYLLYDLNALLSN